LLLQTAISNFWVNQPLLWNAKVCIKIYL